MPVSVRFIQEAESGFRFSSQIHPSGASGSRGHGPLAGSGAEFQRVQGRALAPEANTKRPDGGHPGASCQDQLRTTPRRHYCEARGTRLIQTPKSYHKTAVLTMVFLAEKAQGNRQKFTNNHQDIGHMWNNRMEMGRDGENCPAERNIFLYKRENLW